MHFMKIDSTFMFNTETYKIHLKLHNVYIIPLYNAQTF